MINKMIRFYVIVILSVIVKIDCDPLSFRDCGPSDRYINYNNVSITPYPIEYPGLNII
jgi:hypothetical protein